MNDILFTNFAFSQLSVGINASATTIVVELGHGARFPAPTSGDYFFVTLENASLAREIVKVTARTSDTLTVVRAQDGTSALSWLAGDTVALRLNAAAISTMINSVVRKTSNTGSAVLPVGTTAQRDASPAAGYLRFNDDLDKPEVYNGTAWGSVGGGATGGGSDEVFVQNSQNVTTNYTIPGTKNAMSTGPITVNSGVTVTISSGSRWVVI
jgi:hypothetical protein